MIFAAGDVAGCVIRVLGVCGSLQQRSANRATLDVVYTTAESHAANVDDFDNLALIPPFDADRVDEPIDVVEDWRRRVDAADVIVIAAPEYAGALAGAVKNALDWLVGSGNLYRKPVVIVTAGTSGGGHAAPAAGPDAHLAGRVRRRRTRDQHAADEVRRRRPLRRRSDTRGTLVADGNDGRSPRDAPWRSRRARHARRSVTRSRCRSRRACSLTVRGAGGTVCRAGAAVQGARRGCEPRVGRRVARTTAEPRRPPSRPRGLRRPRQP